MKEKIRQILAVLAPILFYLLASEITAALLQILLEKAAMTHILAQKIVTRLGLG